MNKNISLERLRIIANDCDNCDNRFVTISEWIPDAWIPEFKEKLDIGVILERKDISLDSLQVLKGMFMNYDWEMLLEKGKPEHIEQLLDDIPFNEINNLHRAPVENLRVIKDNINRSCWKNIFDDWYYTYPEFMQEFIEYFDPYPPY